MTRATRKTLLVWILRQLAVEFERRGWQLVEKPSKSLEMRLNAGRDVENALLIHEPFNPSELPDADSIGLTCSVNVSIMELERAINKALKRDPQTTGNVSVSLRLCQLVPSD